MSAWPKVRLGEVLRRVERFEPRDELTEYPFAGTYSFARGIFVGERKLGSTFALPKIQRVRQGDFVYCKIMAWEGAFGLVPAEADNCVMSGAFVAYELHRDRIDERFLGYFFKVPDHWRSIGSQSSGTNVRRQSLHPTQFEAAEIPLPPLAEQRRVVARIEELAAQIHEARTFRHQATEEADALVQNQAGKIFERLSREHEARDFGSFSPHVTSGPRNWAKHYETSGARFYRAQDIGPSGSVIEDSKVFITPPPGNQGRSATLQTGDLMLVITGATVGRACVFRGGLEPGFVSQHVAICRLPQSAIDPEFALWALRSPFGQSQLLGQRYGQGKPGLNLTNIKSLKLPFPPLPVQRRIVAELDALQAEVDALKRHQAETAAELDALLPALLDRAFKGELCGSATTVNISPRRP
ncbi:MAG: restriction endonuclease subunit S [Candidatus Didemnitutus sp.]|nr:restriction endonuclease subunit S [Candidatus Didemnitutus sp.]